MDYVQRIVENERIAALTEEQILGDSIQPSDVGQPWMNRDSYRFYHAIGMTFKPETLLEIGVRFGYSIKSMAIGSGRLKMAYGFDSEYDLEGSLEIARKNLVPVVPDLRLVKCDTQTVNTLGLTDLVDVAHVDAWHTNDGCYHDCLLAEQCLKDGGILLIDDVGDNEHVRECADRFCRERNLVPQLLNCYHGMYVVPFRRSE
jgi:predicted O-methyltransferase YrrM